MGRGPARPPLVGGRCAVMRPTGEAGAGAAMAAACMRSSRAISEPNLAASSCSPKSCACAGSGMRNHMTRGMKLNGWAITVS